MDTLGKGLIHETRAGWEKLGLGKTASWCLPWLLLLILCLKLWLLLFCLTQGLSFLEVKDQLLLMYLMDLSHLILDKASGGSLQGHPAVLRLVEIRTVGDLCVLEP